MAWNDGPFVRGEIITAAMMNKLLREDFEAIVYVKCDYCRREQARPKDGRCAGCGAPVGRAK